MNKIILKDGTSETDQQIIKELSSLGINEFIYLIDVHQARELLGVLSICYLHRQSWGYRILIPTSFSISNIRSLFLNTPLNYRFISYSSIFPKYNIILEIEEDIILINFINTIKLNYFYLRICSL